MQTKPCPFVPTATWTLGNCLISNFGEVPAGLCFYNLSSLHVTCFQHVVTVIFSLHSLSCNRTVNLMSGHVKLPGTAFTERNVFVCVDTCWKGEATPTANWRGKIWKNRKQPVERNPSPCTAGMLNKTADGLFLEIKCGKLALGELRLKAEGSLGPGCVQIMCISRNMNKVSLNWSVSSFS